ncbi:hypothetical protein ABZ470_26670 [Streptosporangium sp. NPDC020072]|uniref:hypothetical protein n=1 Tax=Streptosporangium sp. NPDC020072 TaxID=3154788 RepID=UPI00343417F5
MFQPNRTAAQIITRLRRDGFTVDVPAEPYRRVYQLRLSRGLYLGALDVSADKGRSLRISLTWVPNRTKREGGGASEIIDLLNCLPEHGWTK